jgi:hypothetical protein
MEHKCINKEVIEALRKELQHLQTKCEVLESNVNAVKENIKDMKLSIKEMSSKIDSINHTNIVILSGVVLALIGIIANFFIK